MPQNINLHSPGRTSKAVVSRSGATAVVLVTLVAIGALYALEARRQAQLRVAAQDAERAVTRMEKQLVAAPEAVRHAQADLDTLEAEVSALEAVAGRLGAGVLGRTTGFTGALRALAREKTDGVWLTGIRFDNTFGQIALEGKALDAARVPTLIERLRRAPQFAGTTFATIELRPGDEGPQRAPLSLVRFRLATPVVETDKAAGGGKP